MQFQTQVAIRAVINVGHMVTGVQPPPPLLLNFHAYEQKRLNRVIWTSLFE